MVESERRRRQQRFDETKSTIRRIESLFEIIVLALTYYIVWRIKYDVKAMPNYNGNGKYVLILVYAFLNFILFSYSDGFKFGHIKLTDVTISQWISMFFLNTITYFQISLIANRLLSVIPMLLLTGLDIVITFILSYIFTAIYHAHTIPKQMIMIYGKDNAPMLKRKMDSRVDKYQIKVKDLKALIGDETADPEAEKYPLGTRRNPYRFLVKNDSIITIKPDFIKMLIEKV